MKRNRRLSGKEHVAPWERALDRVLSPIEVFIHRQTTSGVLLMLCAVVALIIANSQWADAYHHFFQLYLTIGLENFQLSKSLHHWINDGFMALFFLVVGLELKRELLVGELANIKQAMLPIIAAVGGMLVPALIYFAINPSGHTADGWGIPMATDIAFALGALALLGKRIPQSLLMFLVALAIVDDLGAVIVIALFYTDTLNMTALALAGFFIFTLTCLNLGGVRRLSPYLMLGAFLWVAMLKSGIHATLAGVLIAMTIPLKEKDGDKALLYRAEHALHPWVAFLILPLFAFGNAGVSLSGLSLADLAQPLTLGIAAGLFIGKQVGVFAATWIGCKSGLAKLPQGVTWQHVYGVACLTGVGFTMSLFIGSLAFSDADTMHAVRVGVMTGSIMSGVVACRCYCRPEPNRATIYSPWMRQPAPVWKFSPPSKAVERVV